MIKYRYWCVSCGNTYDPFYATCPDCRNVRIRLYFKEKWAERIADGHRPASWKKRAKKAYYTRMANMYFSDFQRFIRLMSDKDPKIVSQIKRKVRAMAKKKSTQEGNWRFIPRCKSGNIANNWKQWKAGFPYKGIDDPKYIKDRDAFFTKNGNGWWWCWTKLNTPIEGIYTSEKIWNHSFQTPKASETSYITPYKILD